LVRLKPAGLGRGKSARSANSRPVGEGEVLRWIRQVVARVNELEPAAQQRSDDELRARTTAYRDRLASGEPTETLLPDAFATVREAARRAIGLRHHDVQIMGGAVLHLGKIAEMRTGEGKTLTATLPAYLGALTGRNVHVLTANDYLADRDHAWMQPVYEFLGLSAGLLRPAGNPDRAVRRLAYAADVTYGAWGEYCYDFLRDNLAWNADGRVQRGLELAIVDEADLILLDEMRARPQITGPAPKPTVWPKEFAIIAARLRPGIHYTVDLKARQVGLTDQGIDRVEDWLGVENLYDERTAALVHLLENSLKAKELYLRDREYTISGTEVVTLDEFSGRPKPGVRYADGLHEAIEAKEGLQVRPAGQALAMTSGHAYLSQYSSVTGMTGTAVSEAAAYRDIYHLDVVAIPTNRPMIRIDHPDLFYRTRESKLAALAVDAGRRQVAGQPVLIGTQTAEDAQVISGLLTDGGVAHELLTAGNPLREAEILAEAGRPEAVTVVVKMAGRGVDIVLGGATGSQYAAVADAGGLCVLGAERSVSRRVELHLRGRAGRQGDPGESRFYSAAEDVVMRAVPKIAQPGSSQGGMQLRALSTLIDRAQASAAASQASWLLTEVDYDEVLAEQQRLVYADRCIVLEEPDLRARVLRMIDEVVRAEVADALRSGADAAELIRRLGRLYPTQLTPAVLSPGSQISADGQAAARIAELAAADAAGEYERREAELGGEILRQVERRALLSVTDRAWRDHLAAMTDMDAGLRVRYAGCIVPLPEYRREAARLFAAMTAALRTEAVRGLLTIKVEVK